MKDTNQDVLKKFKKAASSVKLTKEEKNHHRNQLLHFMAQNGANKPSALRTWWLSFSHFAYTFKGSRTVYASLLIVVILGSGVSFAAKDSLPGDALYPFKVKVLEKVEGTLAVSTEQKAEFHHSLAERRLEEAEVLVANNTFNTEAKNELAASFEEHAQAFTQEVNGLKQKNDLKAAEVINSNFAISLNVHSKILASMNANNEQPPIAAKAIDRTLESNVAATVKTLLKVESEVNTQITAQPKPEVQSSADAKMVAAQETLNEVARIIAAMKESVQLSVEFQTKASLELQVAQNLFNRGKVQFERKMYGGAFLLFQRAQKQALEIKLLLQANQDKNLHLDSETLLSAPPLTSPETSPEATVELEPTTVPIQIQTRIQLP